MHMHLKRYKYFFRKKIDEAASVTLAAFVFDAGTSVSP